MISVKNLTKDYNGEMCLKGINLDIDDGDFVALEGESGSGKTTFLEILAGVRTPTSGTVSICGEDVFSMKGDDLARLRRTKMGVVYQYYSLISTLTVEDNIRMPLSLEKVAPSEINEKVKEICARLGIEGVLKKYPPNLSGGQQQRAAVARAAIYNPEVLLLDEPTGALDSDNSGKVLEFLSELNETRGTTILMITHSDSAAAAARRTIRIKDGQIV